MTSLAKSKKMVVLVGRCYELQDGRKARLKFLGDTKFAGGEWLGMELLEGQGEGKHDGVVKGKRYFKTSNRPPRGIFVRRKKIKVEIPDVKAPRMSYGPSNPKSRSPRRSRLAKRIAKKKAKEDERKNYDDGTVKTADGKAKKLGPRDIGRVSNPNWKPAKFEVNTDSTSARTGGLGSPLSQVSIEKREKRDAQHFVMEDGRRKKLGPREIGRIDGWKPAKYENVDLKNDGAQGASFLTKRRVYNTDLGQVDKRAQLDTQHYVGNDGKLKKLGPRQIGRIEGWKPAKYSTSDTGAFLGKKRMYGGAENGDLTIERRQKLDTQHYYLPDGSKKKLGPRQIGRIEGWKPAKYELSETPAFLGRRGIAHTNKVGVDTKGSPRLQTDTQTFITSDGKRKKLGPREIGHIEGWKPAKYEISDTGGFLEKKRISLVGFGTNNQLNTDKRQKRDTQHFYDDHGRAKKLGPRQIGRIEGWKPAKYEVQDTGAFLEKRGSSYASPTSVDKRMQRDTQHFVDEHGRKKKLGPREIGRMEGWKAAEYEVPDTGEFLEKRSSSYRKISNVEIRGQTDAGSVMIDGRAKKLGPRQIGTAKGYRPLKVEEEPRHEMDKAPVPRKKRLSTSRHAQKQQRSSAKQTDSPTEKQAPEPANQAKTNPRAGQQQQKSSAEDLDLAESGNGFPFSFASATRNGNEQDEFEQDELDYPEASAEDNHLTLDENAKDEMLEEVVYEEVREEVVGYADEAELAPSEEDIEEFGSDDEPQDSNPPPENTGEQQLTLDEN